MRPLLAPRDPALRVRAFGRDFRPARARRRLRQGRRRASARCSRSASASSRSARSPPRRSPATRRPRMFRLPARSRARQPPGLQQRRRGAAAARASRDRARRRHRRRQHRQDQARRRGRRDRRLRGERERLAPLADYLVVNVSSPNTPGLRDLQAVDKLRPLLAAVRAAAIARRRCARVPLLVKIAPDLADADIDAVADLALELGARRHHRDEHHDRPRPLREPAPTPTAGAGGLSGAPLKARSLAVLRRLRARVGRQARR